MSKQNPCPEGCTCGRHSNKGNKPEKGRPAPFGPRRTPEYQRNHRLFGYNLTADEYDAMLAAQGGGCWACGRLPGAKRLAIDHNHTTGEVRGILCDRCNRLLGAMERTPPAVVAKLVEYRNNPPARAFLGEVRIGNLGRVGTKRWRAQTKRRLNRGKETLG